MKKYNLIVLILIVALFSSCTKDNSGSSILKLTDVKIGVTFDASTKSTNEIPLTKQTPESYKIALKKATLKGADGTADYTLFEVDSLKNSEVYDFTNNDLRSSLLQGDDVPDGDYNSIEIEIYYLEMDLWLKSETRGAEKRNIRIYLSDDAEVEGGLHQPGDLTQINNGVEIGWLLGEGQQPDLDPVSPRIDAYTTESNGIEWYDFAGKSGIDYGPFGDVTFMSNAPHPIYSEEVYFNYNDGDGSVLVVDFNVNECWQFEDKSGDGYFGYSDLDPLDPTRWHMAMPVLDVTLE